MRPYQYNTRENQQRAFEAINDFTERLPYDVIRLPRQELLSELPIPHSEINIFTSDGARRAQVRAVRVFAAYKQFGGIWLEVPPGTNQFDYMEGALGILVYECALDAEGVRVLNMTERLTLYEPVR